MFLCKKQQQRQKGVRGRPFAKGRSGNPGGRPRGSINRSTRAAQLLLDGEATALSRKAVELALAGDPTALRLCLDRTVAPRRDRSVELSRPPMTRAISTIACGNWRPRRRHAAKILVGRTFATISPGIEWRAAGRGSCHTPDTAEDSKPTAELPLLLRPAAALQPRISAAERSRPLYFRCKKQQKQLGA